VDVESLDQMLLAGAAILLLAILAVRVSLGAGLPSLLIYLAMGLLLGETALGIRFDDADLARALAFAALVVILTEGGLTTKWADLRPSLPLGLALASVGVAVSTCVVAVAAHFVLGLGWELAVLLGAVTAPTDAAAVFAVLRRLPVRTSVRGALEAESGLNDAPTVLLVVLLSSEHGLEYGLFGFLGVVALELLGGSVVGAGVGFGGAWILRRVALPASGLYPLAVTAFAVLAYAGAATLHMSGFAAVYIAALILGNSELPHRSTTRSFSEGLAWLAQIGLFIMLGLLAFPVDFKPSHVVEGLVIGVVLTVLARPMSVVACAAPLRFPWREQGFIAFAGLRGAVPIVLATIPLSEQVPQAGDLFNVVFVLVVFLTLATAPFLPWVGGQLGVIVERARDVEVEAAPLDRIAADLLQVHITAESRLHGVEIAELRLPKGASVSLIVRGGASFTPDLRTTLRRGDDLLVVTPRRSREDTERRLQDVSRGGRLAAWTRRVRDA
jgi:cell volume regulation protein A